MTPRMLDMIRCVGWHVAMQGPVLEVGSYIEESQGHLNLRQAFPRGTPYVGTDVLSGPGVDRIVSVLDAEQMNAVADSIQPKTILCLYVVEHIWDLDTAFRVLGGLWQKHPESWLWVSTHQNQPFHGTSRYGDYWRVTTTTMHRLLEEVGGIQGAHVLVHADTSNPEDVVGVRQPTSLAFPVADIEAAFRTTAAHWEIYC